MKLKRAMPGRNAAATAGKWRRRAGRALLLGALLHAAAALADETPAASWPQVWLNPGIYSLHFDSSKDLRNNNIGIGAEVMLANDHVLMAGNFINSNSARTHFAAYEWRPLHWQFHGTEVSAGIAVGAFDGYPNYHDGGWFAAALPLLSIEGKRLGVNLGLIPTYKDRMDGALAIQVKLRVW